MPATNLTYTSWFKELTNSLLPAFGLGPTNLNVFKPEAIAAASDPFVQPAETLNFLLVFIGSGASLLISNILYLVFSVTGVLL